MADALPQSMVDENGRELCLEVNTTNGYFFEHAVTSLNS